MTERPSASGRKGGGPQPLAPPPTVRVRVDVECKLTRSYVVDVPAITENKRELHSIAETAVRGVIEERPDVFDRAAWRWLPGTLWVSASDQAPAPDVSVTEEQAREVLERNRPSSTKTTPRDPLPSSAADPAT